MQQSPMSGGSGMNTPPNPMVMQQSQQGMGAMMGGMPQQGQQMPGQQPQGAQQMGPDGQMRQTPFLPAQLHQLRALIPCAWN